jgi:hypothetical protein
MFRRRRPLKNEAIHFSFDSFLDLVTNVVGIIIRLILVSWVGARSYHASMTWLELEPVAPPTPTPKVTDDPLHARVEQSQRDLDEAKTRLLAQLKDLNALEQTTQISHEQFAKLLSRREELEAERKSLESKASQRGTKVQLASLTVEDVRKRSKKLLDDIKKLDEAPTNKKQLKYHAPVSQTVRSEELFFECKSGRVTYIDLPSFMHEIKQSLEDLRVEMRTKSRVERTTAQVGPYRLRYYVERSNTLVDNGSYGLSAWEVEPTTTERGETLQQALAAKSEFRQLTDALDSNVTVVTFWVYPDSFELFRQLRDHLYERGHDVAGRPLPPNAPIAASRHGTASRGQ